MSIFSSKSCLRYSRLNFANLPSSKYIWIQLATFLKLDISLEIFSQATSGRSFASKTSDFEISRSLVDSTCWFCYWRWCEGRWIFAFNEINYFMSCNLSFVIIRHAHKRSTLLLMNWLIVMGNPVTLAKWIVVLF